MSYNWSLGTSVQAQHLDFRPQKWVTGWIPSKRWVPQGGTHRTTRPQPSTLHGYLPALWWLERLDFEDLKAPYLSTSMFEIVRTRWRGVIWIPTPEILPRLKSSFGTSCGGQLSELLKRFLNEVFCEAGGENQPRLIKVGVDSPTKKRWGVFSESFWRKPT